jgi:phosphoribosyl 1,2-cyclic phosphate phosphodiesterase
MKITYYGTAAGEGWPCVFCECGLCNEARRLGGKNIRTRSQSLINDDLLLDFPPDNMLHANVYGLDFRKVDYLFVTHDHSDHFYAPDLELLREPYTHGRKKGLRVYGPENVGRKIDLLVPPARDNDPRFVYERAIPFKAISVGDYEVTPLLAKHDRTQECLIYLVRSVKEDKTVLYCHDTGSFPKETFDFIVNYPHRLNLVSLDCTQGEQKDGDYHMGFVDACAEKERLQKAGICAPDCLFVLNHFSHNGRILHGRLTEMAKEKDMLVSYDGLEIEF